ncbi:MAG: phytanoyl-CoA dioxygenase family protein [Alphaproteobacteria bacterium]|nr:phytanoyl-CoA dioxygenase family protein [Alphaproteobacteria bacterium]
MISNQEIELYRRSGYLFVPEVFSPAEITELRAATDEFVERSREVSEHNEVYDLEDDHTATRPRVRRIKTPHLHHPAYAAAAGHEKVVDILGRLIGPGLRFDTGKLNLKEADGGAAVEWHQDWAFYPHTNDDLAAVGIMLDDVDAENGPLMVIPGSHRGPVYDHHSGGAFCGAIDVEKHAIALDQAVPVLGPAGSISIHHCRTLHGSVPNSSLRPRRLLLFQYLAADAFPLLGVPDIAEFDSRLLNGQATLEPRLADVPVRMPLPPAPHQGSIFENQRSAANSFLAKTG